MSPRNTNQINVQAETGPFLAQSSYRNQRAFSVFVIFCIYHILAYSNNLYQSHSSNRERFFL